MFTNATWSRMEESGGRHAARGGADGPQGPAAERERLCGSEAGFRGLADHSDAVLWLREFPSGRLVYVNPAYERVWGLPRERLLRDGDLWADLLHPDDRDRVLAALRRERGTEFVVEFRIVRTDGELRWIRKRSFPVPDAEGRVVGVGAVLCDVTERRTSRTVLSRKEARFRALVEHGQEIITVLGAEGTIRYESPAVERVLGYPPAEHVGRSVFAFVHPDDRARAERRLARAPRAPGPTSFEVRVRHRNGTYRTLSALAVNRLHEPGVEGFVVNSRDVTEQRAGEERLRHAQKLEGVGRLAGGIAHDFNNVLTTIRACAQLLLIDLPEGSPWREDVAEIDRAGARAAALTRQLLAFSRHQVLHPEILDLNAVVRASAWMLRLALGERVDLEMRLCDSAQVEADRSQVEQLLMNLAVNARDAMPGGGTLTVETRAADRAVAGLRPGPHVALRVADTGTGIPEEVRQRIFEPFFTTKARGKGTGLGLATVYGIVQQSGGTIQVESEPGRGTTFTIRFPFRPQG